MARHRGCLNEPEPGHRRSRRQNRIWARRGRGKQRFEDSALVRRTRERYEAVQTLQAQGKGIQADHVRTWDGQGNGSPVRLRRQCRRVAGQGRGHRPSALDEFKPYLHDRWKTRCTNCTPRSQASKRDGGSSRWLLTCRRSLHSRGLRLLRPVEQAQAIGPRFPLAPGACASSGSAPGVGG